MLVDVNDVDKNYGLQLNREKTGYMLINDNISALAMESITIQRVKSFQYLGTRIEDSNDQTTEMKWRIEIAGATFMKSKYFLNNNNLNRSLRDRMKKCYIFSILLYGV